MTIEACAIPRQKEFKYRVEMNGFPVALVREFSPGKRTHGVTEHAGAGQNHPDKEAGMVKYANARLRYVMPLEGDGQTFFEDWLNQEQDPSTGNGGAPGSYRKDFNMYTLNPDGSNSSGWRFELAFPVDHDPNNRDSMNTDKDVIEEVEIAYVRRVKI